ncbi:nucleotide exchange factor Sil1 isoform X2 [Parasteatoda tepidariorum]|uniref:nucleotide exchange factor Sil1 isoform X2 n=1 Tax=Parasteatoda tepidariorum TaxID=114398 RepID=UPI0039BC2F8E
MSVRMYVQNVRMYLHYTYVCTKKFDMGSSFKFILEISVISVLSCCCLGQNSGMVALNNIGQPETSEVLSKKDLKSIHGVAKNISYSKGKIIKSREGDFEYRRSFTSKVEIEVNSLQLQNVITEIRKIISQNSFAKSLLLENLDFLENLVHQYDIGKKFVDIGGFQLILSLTRYKDEDISKAAFNILSAAMQGNQEVQIYATKTDLLKFINDTLTSLVSYQTSSVLLTLSTFVRNCPEALSSFIEKQGIQTLSLLLNNSWTIRKVQMRIVDVLRDMTAEIYDDNPDTVSSLLLRIKKNFTRDIELYSVCDKIMDLFLTFNEYKFHEKIVSAMTTMLDICKEKFKIRNATKKLKTLMKLYDPFKRLNLWYEPIIDVELRYYIFQDLKELIMKLTSYTVDIKNDTKRLKTEL